jgi:hypothetical protein
LPVISLLKAKYITDTKKAEENEAYPIRLNMTWISNATSFKTSGRTEDSEMNMTDKACNKNKIPEYRKLRE